MQIFRHSTDRQKINQIPDVIFQDTSQFSFKYCITLQCHDTWSLWNFLAETWSILDKKMTIKVQFLDFSLNSSRHFWNQKVKVYPNFASLFSAMKDNFLYFFIWNFTWYGQKKPIKVQNFRRMTAHVKFQIYKVSAKKV